MRVISIVNHGDRPANAAHVQFVLDLLREGKAANQDVVLALPPNHTIEFHDLPDIRVCAYCLGMKQEDACPGCGAAADHEFLIEMPTRVRAEWHEEA